MSLCMTSCLWLRECFLTQWLIQRKPFDAMTDFEEAFDRINTWLLYLSGRLTKTKSPNVLENLKQRNMVYTCKNLWNQGSKQVAGWKVWWRPFGSSPNNRLPCAPLLSYCQNSHQLFLFQFICWNILEKSVKPCSSWFGSSPVNYLSPPCSASEYGVFPHKFI